MLKWFRRNKAGDENSAPTATAGEEVEAAASATPDAAAPAETKPGLFARLRERLGKTQSALALKLRAAVGLHPKLDAELIEEIEHILISADVGPRATAKILDQLKKEAAKGAETNSEAAIGLVQEAIAGILGAAPRPLDLSGRRPAVALFVGVNGTGKTTTIGKLALELSRQGRRVLLVAGDTFRAAAAEQLGIWAERAGAGLVSGKEGADPASICFEALEAAKKDEPDVILIDTAGRLHTKTHLMNELDKVIRVIKKVYPDAPHETILVLDATTGQNALNQAQTFKDVAQVTGLVMTKLDGTAKGGILIAIREAHDLPIYKIGIGEAPEDLRDFDPKEFAAALFAGA